MASSSSLVTSKWLISNGISDFHGINPPEFKDMLDTMGISYQFVAKEEIPPPAHTEKRVPSDVLSQAAVTIWERDVVKVQITHDRERHLLVRPIPPVSFSEIPLDNLCKLKTVVGKLQLVFFRVFGNTDYSEQLLESKEDFAFELIPGFTASPALLNYHDKMQRNLYLLSKGSFVSYSLPEEKIEGLAMAIQAVCGSDNAMLSDNPIPREYLWIDISNAQKLSMTAYLIALQENGMPVSAKEIAPIEAHDLPPLRKEIKSCGFCSEAIINRQLIFSGNDFFVLYNHRPYIQREGLESRHILLVSKRHLENSVNAKPEELDEERKLIGRIVAYAKKAIPNAEPITWRQKGVGAGQTVPHHHTHVLIAEQGRMAEFLIQVASELVGKPFPPVAQPSPLLAGYLMEK